MLSYAVFVMLAIYCPLIILGHPSWGGGLTYKCEFGGVLGGSYCKGNSGRSSSVTAAPSPKIIRVDFHTERQSIDKVEQIYAAESTAEACCPEKQRKMNRCTDHVGPKVDESIWVTTTNSFEHSHGVAVTAGTKFTAGLPKFLGTETNIEVSNTNTWTWGKTETRSERHTFTKPGCVATPGQRARCDYFVARYTYQIPYTMYWDNGNETHGFFKAQGTSDRSRKHPEFPKCLNPPIKCIRNACGNSG